jgi:2-keto-4-pentenoate hydratase/2-oxohepta-3-ene-1,7-dioic acid hydratase in catechol pathway
MIERGGKALPLADLLNSVDFRHSDQNESIDMMALLEDWATWHPRLEQIAEDAADQFATSGEDIAGLDYLPPIALPRKLICIGANYHDHIAEMGIPMAPTIPYAFLKAASTTLRGSGQPVEKPRDIEMFDWEAELAVVIGQTCKNVAEVDALGVVAGYANFNDLSARDWVGRRLPIGVDWVLHKGYDGFGPMGPWLVPAAYAGDPSDMPVKLSVNGVVKQDSSTAQMVFGVAQLIAHLSSTMTLEPGDVIATGTPAGVGHGRKPPEFLNPGDEIRIEIGNLGELVTPIIG